MKTYSVILFAFAAVAHAKNLPTTDSDTLSEEDAAYWQKISNLNAYGKNAWLGVFQGLYGMSSKVERPDDACFGEWIPEHLRELYEFRTHAGSDLMMVDMDEAKKSAYNIVDLIFLNDEYCHFRKTFWNVDMFCKETDSCDFGTMMENMQKNAFGIITQMSTAASIFKEQPWEEMDQDSREYALNQMGHSMAALYADLIGFSAVKMASILQ